MLRAVVSYWFAYIRRRRRRHRTKNENRENDTIALFAFMLSSRRPAGRPIGWQAGWLVEKYFEICLQEYAHRAQAECVWRWRLDARALLITIFAPLLCLKWKLFPCVWCRIEDKYRDIVDRPSAHHCRRHHHQFRQQCLWAIKMSINIVCSG